MTDTYALYVELMKRCLTNMIYRDGNISPFAPPEYDAQRRASARDWPEKAHTMIGRARLDNIQMLAESVLAESVPGDFMECGVWRGGATIFMRAILRAHGDVARQVWVADSFAGLPAPDLARYPQDRGLEAFSTFDALAVPLEQVKDNFERYDLLDERVRFLPGFFSATLPTAPVERLSLLRLDGDMYESTFEALTHLYPKLSPGGYCIVDDYGDIAPCKRAVEDYRRANAITAPIEVIDWAAVYWRKSDQ